MEELAFIDEHATDIAALPEVVWSAALRAFGGAASTSATWAFGARLLGCDPKARQGWDHPGPGTSIPGFRITAFEPPQLLVLAGRHRFAAYAIVLRIEATGVGARCRLESRANFPGLHGGLYRAAVIGSRGHVFGVRRILNNIRREAEQPFPRVAEP
jgi:hypothetical protein